MANICENKFYVYSDNNIEKLMIKFTELFEHQLSGEITYNSDHFFEGYFSSKWSFPEHIFENLFDEFEDESIYFRCISEEYGNGYVSMNIYVKNEWKDPQYFDLYE